MNLPDVRRRLLAFLLSRWVFPILLGIFTLVVLLIQRDSKTFLVLLGASIAFWVSSLQEWRREAADAVKARRRDLDETRRLTYMALIASKSRHPELVGTVGHALAYHGLAVPFDQAAHHLAAVVDHPPGMADDQIRASEQWLRDLIDRITRERGE